MTLLAQQVTSVPEDKVLPSDQKNDQDDDVDSLFGDDVPERLPTPYVDLSLLHDSGQAREHYRRTRRHPEAVSQEKFVTFMKQHNRDIAYRHDQHSWRS